MIFDKAIQLNPEVSEYYNNKGLKNTMLYLLGNSLENLKKNDESILMYDKAIQLNP